MKLAILMLFGALVLAASYMSILVFADNVAQCLAMLGVK